MSTAEKRPASAEAPPPNPYEGQRLTGAEAVIRSLETCGVEICFGIPGGAILPIYDALASTGTTIKHVLVRHEQGAGHMAQGYARATGKVGVAMATSGPGATNLVTPVADAFLDSTPLVIVTGQVPTPSRRPTPPASSCRSSSTPISSRRWTTSRACSWRPSTWPPPDARARC